MHEDAAKKVGSSIFSPPIKSLRFSHMNIKFHPYYSVLLSVIAILCIMPGCGKQSRHKKYVDSIQMQDTLTNGEVKKRKKFLITCFDYIDDVDGRYGRENRLVASLDKRTDLTPEQKEQKLQHEIKKLIQLKRNFNSFDNELNEPWTFLHYKNNLEKDLSNLKLSIETLENQQWHAVTKKLLASMQREYDLLDKVFEAIYLDTDVVRDWQVAMLSDRVKSLVKENKNLERDNKQLEVAVREKDHPIIFTVPDLAYADPVLVVNNEFDDECQNV